MATPRFFSRTTTNAPRVLVADDEPVFRGAARAVLMERRGYTVVAEAGCAASALEYIRSIRAAGLDPGRPSRLTTTVSRSAAG